MAQFKPVETHRVFEPAKGMRATLRNAGHIGRVGDWAEMAAEAGAGYGVPGDHGGVFEDLTARAVKPDDALVVVCTPAMKAKKRLYAPADLRRRDLGHRTEVTEEQALRATAAHPRHRVGRAADFPSREKTGNRNRPHGKF